ncbi:MAG: DUF262 domain-containing protein [Cyclobacteriaceae bacterium]|nr:DUF262 domain-containing protein [Cyclobacteriaceae bacterium]
MDINPQKLTIGQLFSVSTEQFVVPEYQRPYAWSKPQYGALYEDLELLGDNDKHLFGMLIIHKPNFQENGIYKLEVIDGQQRLTTLSLLLLSCKQVYFDIHKKTEKVNDILKYLLCHDLDEASHSKLILGDFDNGDYQKLISGKDIQNIRNENLQSAFTYFKDKISSLSFQELNKLFNKLINVAVIIKLDVVNAHDAYKLFETINNRGLSLSSTDIIKNFLLGHASKLNDKEANTLRDVKDIWSEIITYLGSQDPDSFLRQEMSSLLNRKITYKKLVEEFKKHYLNNVEHADLMGEYTHFQKAASSGDEDDEDDDQNEDGEDSSASQKISAPDYLRKIRNDASTYSMIINRSFDDDRINRRLLNLERIQSTPTYIFLVPYFQRERDLKNQLEVLRILEVFMLRRHICEARTSEHDGIFAKLANIRDVSPTSVVEFLQEYTPGDERFRESFPLSDFDGRLVNRARYILEEVELNKRGNTGEIRINSSVEVHLEHIIPQVINTKKSVTEFGDWITYLGANALKDHPKHVSKIGNMTLLAGALNISASNNPFGKKKNAYKKSSILITNELAKGNDFKFSHATKRGKELADLAIGIWKF